MSIYDYRSMKMGYSKDFNEIVRNQGSKLIENSLFGNPNFVYWERNREYVSKGINRSGKILDIGCANGFLLRCLQEWSSYKLVPFGFDFREDLIEQAKGLFPSQKENFFAGYIEEIEFPRNFPKKFETVYWAVWANFMFSKKKEVKALNKIRKYVGNRIIFGFYDCTSRKNIRNKINNLEKLGIKVNGFHKNRKGKGVIVWSDDAGLETRGNFIGKILAKLKCMLLKN